MFIRSKVIKGHTYYYLVRGERHGKKVRQKVVQYLGGGALKAERFSGDVRQKVIEHLAKESSADVARDTVTRTAIPKELEPLAEEARKFDTAEELLKARIKTEIPISRIGGLEPQPAPLPTKKRKITEPIEVVLTDQGDFILEAGNHRFHQAVFNKDKTIPAIVRFEKNAATNFFNQAKGTTDDEPSEELGTTKKHRP